MNPDQQESGKYLEGILKQFDPFSGDKLRDSIANMTEYARQLNNVFGQSKQRISELMKSVADAEPRIIRLGGNIAATFQTMEGVSRALQRNITVSEDTLAGIYASSEVLGQTSQTLVDNFADAGYQAASIGKEASESVLQIQNLGLNTQQIMGTVMNNMSELNKFNFNNGVQGLTKMAAQAAMVRFNMADALTFAEKVQDPEAAIQMAAGLQRLGVAAGALADPFAMMNASINDPGALQDSLINMTKQFSYFDEKSKSFKISPQGILTMKELAKETGISYDTLSKTSLAAAELDKRLTQISPTIKFASEEDKQYIANLGAMNEKGEYTVKLESGIEKKLTDLTQQEFDNLIKQQKEGPKTVEDIARAQLKSSDAAAGALASISKAYYNGVASVQIVRDNLVSLSKMTTVSTGVASDLMAKPEFFRDTLEKLGGIFKGTLAEIREGKKTPFEILKEFSVNNADLLKSIKQGGDALLTKGLQELEKRRGEVGTSTDLAKAFQKLLTYAENAKGMPSQTAGSTSIGTQRNMGLAEPARQFLLGNQVQQIEQNIPRGNRTLTSEMKNTVDFTGSVTFKFDVPPGLSAKEFDTYLKSEEFKRLIYSYWEEKQKELGRQR